MSFRRLLGVISLALSLGGCGAGSFNGSLGTPSRVGLITSTAMTLERMPAPRRPINVAVYDFPDLTGQNKPSVNFSDFSRAITQGAPAILVDALKEAGHGTWFNVVERGNLDSLLRERKLIQDTYAFLKKDPKPLIDPLRFADYIVTGGVISFDTTIFSGNIAATYKGIGGSAGQSRDLVTINLRIVRVKDGEVLRSINVSRPIIMNAVTAQADRTISGGLLSAAAALSVNEARQIAVREAIELGVYQLAADGLHMGLWTLDDPLTGPLPPAAPARHWARGVTAGRSPAPSGPPLRSRY